MNRIIIIGNGFDIAHGMNTSYKDFIDDFWLKTIEKVNKINFGGTFENKLLLVENVPDISRLSIKTYEELYTNLYIFNSNLRIKNYFLEHITKTKSIKNWVDIEEEYYKFLMDIVSQKPLLHYKNIEKLNSEFEDVKNLLEDYLNEIEKKFQEEFNDIRIKSSVNQKVYSFLNFNDLTEDVIKRKVDEKYEEIHSDIEGLKGNHISIGDIIKNKELILKINCLLPKDKIKSIIRENLLLDDAFKYFDVEPDNILLLNFNYTENDFYYRKNKFNKKIDVKYIHIHGNLNKEDNNPIIFGFGDEIDEKYKDIENLNDNRFLENIKSIKYLETDNYRRLIEFINSDEYQIFIFGHSCGISDRTLLSTLFQNNNCKSIKPYYYKKNNKEDNYSDLIRNISRNFENKTLMRNIVVNKNYCEPLT